MTLDVHTICVLILEYLLLLIVLLACIWPLLRKLLWACRVSIISAFAGYYLFLLVVQAQDLFADTSLGNQPLFHILYWAFAFAALFLIWAFPVHYAARKILDEPDRLWLSGIEYEYEEATFRRLQKWIPRILGCVPIGAYLVGVASAWYETRHILDLVPYLETQFILLTASCLVTLGLFIWFVCERQRLALRFMGPSSKRLLKFGSIAITSLIVVLFCLFPIGLTHYISRAMMIPFLFGSWVLGFSLIASWAHRVAMPLFVFLAAGLTALVALNVHFNDIRTLSHDAAGTSQFHLADRQLQLDDAIARWRIANACDAGDIKTCPPAVIVASEGGASRAAFFTAAVVGHILDQIHAVDLQGANEKAASNPARSIFAMSGVSGGAFGLAAIKAALLDARNGKPPCRKKAADQGYFKNNYHDYLTAKTSERKTPPPDPTAWRDCLEMLVDGDYLSPVFIGLGYRDNIAIWPFNRWVESWVDRAALLEQAWEKHYLTLTSADPNAISCTAPLDARGLCHPLGYSNRPSDVWTPLLLLNGTSVQSGRRIIASELHSTYTVAGNPDAHPPLYQWAYDIFEMLNGACPSMDPAGPSCTAIQPDTAPDIRLSTAALLSARFPLISPAGTIRMQDGVHGDSVVDGGYFENSGLTTALNVARALHEKGLQPIILAIANDPLPPIETSTPASPDAARPVMPNHLGAGPTIGTPPDFLGRAAGTITAPLSALYNTRSGHGDEAGASVARELEAWYRKNQSEEIPPAYFPFKVFARPNLQPGETPFEMPQLSMSWWLSSAVQRALDGQLLAVENDKQFGYLMKRLKPAP